MTDEPDTPELSREQLEKIRDAKFPWSSLSVVAEMMPEAANDLARSLCALALRTLKAEAELAAMTLELKELTKAAIHYVDVSKSARSQFISENGRHGKSPWAELCDAVTAARAEIEKGSSSA